MRFPTVGDLDEQPGGKRPPGWRRMDAPACRYMFIMTGNQMIILFYHKYLRPVFWKNICSKKILLFIFCRSGLYLRSSTKEDKQ